MLDPQTVTARIAAGLPGAEVEVRDFTGTGDHFEARVVSPAFDGKSMVEQHQLVYGTVQDLINSGELHALALKTYSPDQWRKLSGR